MGKDPRGRESEALQANARTIAVSKAALLDDRTKASAKRQARALAMAMSKAALLDEHCAMVAATDGFAGASERAKSSGCALLAPTAPSISTRALRAKALLRCKASPSSKSK